jgi:hypothetical protein
MSQPAEPANLNIRVFTQSGSKTEVGLAAVDFRSSPQSRHPAGALACPKSATTGLFGRINSSVEAAPAIILDGGM